MVKRFNKRIVAMAMILMMAVGMLSGCKTATSPESKKYSIVCTIFPEYDWIREILGKQAEEFDVTYLLDSATDLHSYQPTAQDIAKISSCDLFVYVGGESDAWVGETLKEAVNKDMIAVSLLDLLGEHVKEEELVEGMEAEEEEAEGEEEEAEYDEHVWLSLKNAKIAVSALTEDVKKIDEANQSVYQKNSESYISKLDALDAEYKKAIDSADKKTLVFGDRFPFRYMVEDYGLNYYAAFIGCSAETEASFETVIFLAEKVDEQGLKYVLTIENSDQKIAEAIIRNTKDKNQEILAMDSMQSVIGENATNQTTYLSVMESNLEVLKTVLMSK